MMWKERGINKYPEIILSDCLISKIEKNEDDFAIDFGKQGFFVKDLKKNTYYRTASAQIIVKGCDINNITIKEVRTQQLSDELFFESMYDVKADHFLDNINSEKWKFEVVEEFYSAVGALYIGWVSNGEKSFWCCVKLQFKELLYLWDEVQH